MKLQALHFVCRQPVDVLVNDFADIKKDRPAKGIFTGFPADVPEKIISDIFISPYQLILLFILSHIYYKFYNSILVFSVLKF